MALLPSNLVFVAERLLFFFSVAVYSHLATLTLVRSFPVRVPPVLLSLLFLLASTQGFPPMPWHTVDGVLLSVLAVYLLDRWRTAWGVIAGATAIFLAATTKQSFYFMVGFTLLYTYCSRGRRDACIVGLTIGCLAAAAGVALWYVGGLGDFIAQTTHETRIRSLLSAGVLSYLRQTWKLLLLVVGTVAVIAGSRLLLGRTPGVASFPWVALGTVYASSITATLVHRQFQPPVFNYPAALFLVTGAWVLTQLVFFPRRQVWTLAVMFGIAWSASLSWGYQTPLLFAAPILFTVVLISHRHCGTSVRTFTVYLMILAGVAQLLAYRYPYRDQPRRELTHHLGEVFPRLQHVYTSPEQYARHAELRRLHEQFAGRFTVLPGMPLAGYLTATCPPIRVDWGRAPEIAGLETQVISELEHLRPYVFLEKRFCSEALECTSLVNHVAENWELLHAGSYFDVYGAMGEPE